MKLWKSIRLWTVTCTAIVIAGCQTYTPYDHSAYLYDNSSYDTSAYGQSSGSANYNANAYMQDIYASVARQTGGEIGFQVYSGNLEAVKSLLAQGHNINAKLTHNGSLSGHYTLLDLAISHDQIEITRYVLDKGAVPEHESVIFIHVKSVGMAQLLVEFGFEPPEYLVTSLESTLETFKGMPSMAEHMSEQQNLINYYKSVQEDNSSPIFKHAKRGDLYSLQQALSTNPSSLRDVNKRGDSLLHVAAGRGHMEIISFLLKKKIELRRLNSLQQNAMMVAKQKGQTEAAKLLSCEMNSACQSVAKFESYIDKSCKSSNSQSACRRAIKADIDGVFVSTQMKNDLLANLEFKESCVVFNYKKCYDFSQNFSQSVYAAQAKTKLDQHREAVESRMVRDCGTSSNLSRCKRFAQNHPGYDNHEKVVSGIRYLSQKCYVKETGWFYENGACKGKVMHGRGTAYNPQEGLSYTGVFAYGVRSNGKLLQNNTPVFDGVFKNGKPDGVGVCFHEGEPEECKYYDGKRIDAVYKNRLAFAEQRKYMENQQMRQQNQMAALREDVKNTEVIQYQPQYQPQQQSETVGDKVQDALIDKAGDVLLDKALDIFF